VALDDEAVELPFLYQLPNALVNAPLGRIAERNVTALTLLLPLALAAIVDVPAGAPLGDAIARARPGDVVRLGPGIHSGSLGKIAGLRVEGAGIDLTRVVAPEGQDGAIVTGRVELAGLSLEAGAARMALGVVEGAAILDGVALHGGSMGAFVQDGKLSGSDVRLSGGFGLLLKSGEATLRDAQVLPARVAHAGVAVLRGRLALTRCSVTGPFAEAAVTVSGGSATLEDVVIREPGPTGIAVTRGEVDGRDVEVAGAREVPTRGVRGLDAILGDCVQLRKGTLRLASSGLVRCGGTAVTASGGSLRLDGVDLTGGAAGGLILLDGARADLRGNWVTGRGPALVAMGGSQVEATFNRWRTDPALWVDCGSGARVRMGFGEHVKEPCRSAP
jgi:hypothetical protein